MIPAKIILDREKFQLNNEVMYFEEQIDKVLKDAKSIPKTGIEIKVKVKLTKEAADELAKLYFKGGWQFDYRYETRKETGPAPWNPQKQEETEVFLATVITLKV